MSDNSGFTDPLFYKGQWIFGASAMQARIKMHGGLAPIFKRIARESADNAVAAVLDELDQNVRRRRLKLVS